MSGIRSVRGPRRDKGLFHAAIAGCLAASSPAFGGSAGRLWICRDRRSVAAEPAVQINFTFVSGRTSDNHQFLEFR